MNDKISVPEALMNEIYEKIKTPYKYGAVLKFDDALCDSPLPFFYNGAWYMSFIKIDKDVKSSGYETYIAKSTDLLHWDVLFPILLRTDNDAWDSKQCAAYAAFVKNDLFGNYDIQKVNDAYYFSYLGGNLNGYETDPLMMGECRVRDLLEPSSYVRFEKPILTPFDIDSRLGEQKTLYKSNMFIDEPKTLGYRYVNIYNAKGDDNKESIFLAVSEDGEHWKRYLDHCVFSEPGAKIAGDPQVVRYGSLYIMLYFVMKNGEAYNTFAVSYDLVNWTPWQGTPLIKSEYEWENVYAHKSGLICRDGILYHFYCAVNRNKERFIALATGEKVW